MVIRTYFDKNNTIIKNSQLNTGKNPVTELFYGLEKNEHTFSRFLFHFDESNILKHYSEKDVDNLTHTVKMTNTSNFNDELLNKNTADGKKRTSSFTLEIYAVGEEWNEGTGYDYDVFKDSVNSEQPSNWYKRSTNEFWVIDGAIGRIPTPIASQKFTDGNENIELDITDLVNEYLKGNRTNNGFIITYRVDIEESESEELHYVGFFTRHTQTFYKPYVETKLKEPIKDDRGAFHMGVDNKLYLYTHRGGKPMDIEQPEGETIRVEIFDNNMVKVNDLTATREREGVYSVIVNIPQEEGLINEVFYDNWLNSDNSPIAEMQFELKEYGEIFKVGYGDVEPERYKMVIKGIRPKENIKSGEIRKIYVDAIKQYTVGELANVDDVEYRLYVKEGNFEHDIISFRPINKTFQRNYFVLDTGSLLPNTYYLDIKVKSNLEEIYHTQLIKFNIIK